MRILLIEDDTLIGDGLKVGLTKLGFSVDWFVSGEAGSQALNAAPWDAVVLDLSLPQRDGLDILRQWREQGADVPVLILTARDALDQRVQGLQLGADDYLCKPFALTEVAARLQALIRRRHGQLQPELRHGRLVMAPGSHSVMMRRGSVRADASSGTARAAAAYGRRYGKAASRITRPRTWRRSSRERQAQLQTWPRKATRA